MAELTPVTVLTGFLGAGKTTLLNRILRDPALAGTAVLVNEFGEIGIDHLLVEAIDDDTVLLNAGCICCTIRGDLVRVLREMLPRARRDEITRVIVETTGLADPVPILATLMRDPAVAAAYRLDGVVTVVDAANGLQQLQAHEAARRQVAVADRIILSKTDLSDPWPLRHRLEALNLGVPMIDAMGAEALVIAGLSDANGKIAEIDRWLDRDHDHHNDAHLHDAEFDALCLTWDEPLDRALLLSLLEELAAEYGERLLRIKGIVDLCGEGHPMAVHAAGHLVHPFQRLKSWPKGEHRMSRLVFISAGLSRHAIEVRFKALRSTGPAAPAAGAG